MATWLRGYAAGYVATEVGSCVATILEVALKWRGILQLSRKLFAPCTKLCDGLGLRPYASRQTLHFICFSVDSYFNH